MDWEYAKPTDWREIGDDGYYKLLMYAALKYTSVLLSTPIHNIWILRQIQFCPFEIIHDDVENDLLEKHVFVNKQSLADSSGYLIRKSFHDSDPARPVYQLPRLKSSTMSCVFLVLRMNTEGFASLWKGHVAFFWRDMIDSWMQPNIEHFINFMLRVHDQYPLGHSEQVLWRFLVQVFSGTLSGLITSPLELIETRMIVQTCKPNFRKYRSLIHAFRTISKEEPRVFYTFNIFIPSTIYHIINSFFKHGTSLIIDRCFTINQSDYPFQYVLCELGINILELVIIMPLETVRRRLQCQIRSRVNEARPFETIVATSPIPYTGIWDCAYRILTQEGTEYNRFSGLYRGFQARLVSTILISIVQFLTLIDSGEYQIE